MLISIIYFLSLIEDINFTLPIKNTSIFADSQKSQKNHFLTFEI